MTATNVRSAHVFVLLDSESGINISNPPTIQASKSGRTSWQFACWSTSRRPPGRFAAGSVPAAFTY